MEAPERPASQKCKECGQEFPLMDGFYFNRVVGMYHSTCKGCRRKQAKARREANPDYQREYMSKYRVENAEKLKATQKESNDKRKDAKREYMKARYAQKRGELLAKERERYAKRKDSIKAAQRAYRATPNGKRADLRSSTKRFTRLRCAKPAWVDEEALIAVYEDARKLSLETGIQHHVDHIVPIRGKMVCGLHVPWNLQILTAEDNMRKGNRMLG